MPWSHGWLGRVILAAPRVGPRGGSWWNWLLILVVVRVGAINVDSSLFVCGSRAKIGIERARICAVLFFHLLLKLLLDSPYDFLFLSCLLKAENSLLGLLQDLLLRSLLLLWPHLLLRLLLLLLVSWLLLLLLMMFRHGSCKHTRSNGTDTYWDLLLLLEVSSIFTLIGRFFHWVVHGNLCFWSVTISGKKGALLVSRIHLRMRIFDCVTRGLWKRVLESHTRDLIELERVKPVESKVLIVLPTRGLESGNASRDVALFKHDRVVKVVILIPTPGVVQEEIVPCLEASQSPVRSILDGDCQEFDEQEEVLFVLLVSDWIKNLRAGIEIRRDDDASIPGKVFHGGSE